MPLPPPPPPIFFTTVAAAAKIAVKEYLPTLTSATLAAWLLQWMWQRLPDWIKEDVVWRRRKGKSNSGEQPERLSTLWERHRSLLSVAESLLSSPVPHLPASLLAYVHLSSQLQQQPDCVQLRNAIYQQAGPLLLCNSSAVPEEEDDERRQPEQQQKFDNEELAILGRALDWAVWAYELHDETALRERLLESTNDSHGGGLTLERCVRADRPGSVGYYVAFSDDLLLIAIKGTSSLEDILTDTCGRAVPYQHIIHTNDSSTVVAEASIEVRGRVEDQVVIPSAAESDAGVGVVHGTVIVEDKDANNKNDCYSGSNDPDESASNVSIEVISGHERVLFSGGDTTTIELGVVDPEEDDSQIQCHEGILLSAQTVSREVQAYVQKYVVLHNQNHPHEPSRHRRLRLVGHSLGASVACFVAMILRSRFPSLATTTTVAETTTSTENCSHNIPATSGTSSSSISAPLHVYAFAPPPVVDHDSALASTTYITTVVNNSDVIPRCSLVNLALWLEVLRSISKNLIQHGLAPTTPKKLAKFVQHVYGDGGSSSSSKTQGSPSPLLTVEQIWASLQKARTNFPLRHPAHLYIPGKVLLFYQDWAPESKGEQDAQTTREDTGTGYKCRVTDGTALALQTLEVDGFRWIGDHTTAAYYRCLSDMTIARPKSESLQ